MRIDRGRSALIAGLLAAGLLPAAGLAAQLNEGAVTGRIVSLDNNLPVVQAEIRLVGTDLATLSNERGLFRLDRVPPGDHVLRVAFLGFATRTDSLTVAAGTVLDVTIALSIEPIELDPLVAVIRSLVLERAGFYNRQAQGFGGHFMDRHEIVDQRPSKMTDLFRSLPGMRVVYGGIYGSRVFVNQRVTFSDDLGCQPTVWLDGIRSTLDNYDLMRTEELEGLEVYSGGGPGKFNDICGSVLIWTRVPIRLR